MAEASSDVVGKSGWPEVFGRHIQFLLDHLDPDFGLLEQLVTNETLSFEQRHIVKAESTTNQRNRKLLDIIRTEDKWDGLIDALKSSKQTHIVKYLEADGKHSSDVDWPLGEREIKILRTNYMNLIDLIEAPELVGVLYSANVINKSQRDFIRQKKTSSDINAALIDILLRRSIGDYIKTIYFLMATNQPHIACLLDKGGALVGLHVDTDADPEAERKLADKITVDLADSSVTVEGKRRALKEALFNLDLFAAKQGHSVVLYVYLHTIKQLNQLKMSLQSGSIKDPIQLLFNKILSASEKVTVLRVTVTDDELRRVEEFLQEVQGKKISDEKHISIQTDLGLLRRPQDSPEEDVKYAEEIQSVSQCTLQEATDLSKYLQQYRLETDRLYNEPRFAEVDTQTKQPSEAANEEIVSARTETNETTKKEREIAEEFAMMLGNKPVKIGLRDRMMERFQFNKIPAKETQTDKASPSVGHRLFKSVFEDGQRRDATDTDISVETLLRHKSFLEEVIDPDFGLFDDLLRSHTITEKDFRKIKNESPYNKRNSKLLDYIIEQSKCESFVASLRNTKQGHVVNYLAADGEYRSEFGSDWPLTEQQLTILEDDHEELVDLMEMTELLNRLFSKEVINIRQRDKIYAEKKPNGKNEALLEFLRRMSQTDYKKVIECLHESKQSFVAQLLEKGGVTVKVRIRADETTEDEKMIAEEFTSRLASRFVE